MREREGRGYHFARINGESEREWVSVPTALGSADQVKQPKKKHRRLPAKFEQFVAAIHW